MTNEEYLAFAEEQCTKLITLIRKKNADYTNGGSAFSNFEGASEFGIDPLVGLSIRMSDKMQRLKSYCRQGKLQVNSEGVDDIFKDLIGYSLLGLGMLEQKRRQHETSNPSQDELPNFYAKLPSAPWRGRI